MDVAPRIAPDVLPPAFFPVGLNLVGRRCVVIGDAGDREALEKVAALREVGADVRWIQQHAGLDEADVRDAYLVIFTPQLEAPAALLRGWAERHRFLFCAIDQPKYGFVALAAVVTAGRARIAISTGGAAPRVARVLREALASALDGAFARFLECLAHQRRRVRASAPDAAGRRAGMIEATDGFSVEIRLTYPHWFRQELRGLGPSLVDEP
jgi:siroheme synthase-like protein